MHHIKLDDKSLEQDSGSQLTWSSNVEMQNYKLSRLLTRQGNGRLLQYWKLLVIWTKKNAGFVAHCFENALACMRWWSYVLLSEADHHMLSFVVTRRALDNWFVPGSKMTKNTRLGELYSLAVEQRVMVNLCKNKRKENLPFLTV